MIQKHFKRVWIISAKSIVKVFMSIQIIFYYGEYTNDIGFVQELYKNDIPFGLSKFVVIVWETTARNIMYDYFESNGHYFRF